MALLDTNGTTALQRFHGAYRLASFHRRTLQDLCLVGSLAIVPMPQLTVGPPCFIGSSPPLLCQSPQCMEPIAHIVSLMACLTHDPQYASPQMPLTLSNATLKGASLSISVYFCMPVITRHLQMGGVPCTVGP